MLKLRLIVPLILIVILAACTGNQPPAQENKNDALSTAAVETVRASINLTLTPGATAPQLPLPSSTPAPTGAATATGPQYGPMPAPAATPTRDFSSAKGMPVPWQTPVACKAEAAALQALSSSASWIGDLTNDGQVDYVMMDGQGMSIQSCRTGDLQVIAQETTGPTTHLLGVADLNRNGVPEVVVSMAGVLDFWRDGQTHIPPGVLGSDISILEWNGTGFSKFINFVPLMTNGILTDVDGNGTVEIVATSDFQPKSDEEYNMYWDAYPLRKTDYTYAWDGNGYSLMKIQKGPAEYSSELMADARNITDYAAMLDAYGKVVETPGLKGWTPEMDAYKVAMAKYYKGGQQGAAPTAPASNEEVVATDRAWAYYFMILRATAEGDSDLAKLYDSKLQSQLASVEAAKPVVALAAAFWNEYSASLDISQACYQARVFAVQQAWGEAGSHCFYQEKQPPVVLTPPPLPAARTANQSPVTALGSQAEISALPSIWDITKITNLDLLAPGLRSFDQALPQNEPLAWPFFWCTNNNPAVLQRNLDTLTVFFLINGERVPDENILQYHAENPSQQCQFWATILRDWQPGSSVQLEIVYHFRTAVFDGFTKYPAGEYRYRLSVHLP